MANLPSKLYDAYRILRYDALGITCIIPPSGFYLQLLSI